MLKQTAMLTEILSERSLDGKTVRIEAGWMLRLNTWTQSGLVEISQDRLVADDSEDDGPNPGFRARGGAPPCGILVRNNLICDDDAECPGACARWC